MLGAIYKYDTKNIDGIDFKIKGLIRPVCSKIQNEKIMVWCEVDVESNKERVLSVDIKSTGYDRVYDYQTYLDTVVFDNGLVYHIYTTVL